MKNVTTAAVPELLAPAGDLDCVRAAVENGADAIYFGLDHGFNARARATNISTSALPELMAMLRRRGVKGYVTLNTLAFSAELQQMESTIREIAAAGVDAVLVQDFGVARLVKQVCPQLELHASTQMTLTSAETIAEVQQLGIKRVVLARELSITEIAAIGRHTEMPLEVFAHGALCVAYSGQCLTSESLGGRSANRGQCAQACRLPYDLICDGEDVSLGDVRYLLSPQDLAAYSLVPGLLEAGVCSFKIEGRLKTPEYVANITRRYREAIDSAVAGKPVEFTPRQIEEMELSFSRGFSPGWFHGCDHKMLAPGLSSAKRGVLLGQITYVSHNRVRVKLASSIAAGDGIVFDGGRETGEEQGGRVYEVFRYGNLVNGPAEDGVVELAFRHGAIDFDRIRRDQNIWKTDDPKLTKALRKTFTSPDSQHRSPLVITVTAAAGEPLKLSALAASGAHCELESDGPLEAARKHPLTDETLETQFSRLGGTAYELRSINATITGNPMAPLSVLGKLRKQLVAALDSSVVQPPARRIAGESVLPVMRAALPARETPAASPQLRIMCRNMAQLDAALENGVQEVYADFQDIRQYRQAVATAHQGGARIFLATPRIQKPGEMGVFISLGKHSPDGILARNLSGMAYFVKQGIPVVADFSLNITNELSAAFVIEQGASRVTASYDLNREQLLELIAAAPPQWFEVVLHQHMPMFHMEHCVFCAVLSPGTNKTNCGRPCDSHAVQLRDRTGMEHTLTADVGCRNTLYNATPQSAAEIAQQLVSHGVNHFRVELLDDTPARTQQVIRLYRDLLDSRIEGSEVWRQLQAANRVGVTRGTLEERNPLAII